MLKNPMCSRCQGRPTRYANSPLCKSCYVKEHRQKNPAYYVRERAKNQQWRMNNKEHLKLKQRQYTSTPEFKETKRGYLLRYNCGITEADFKKMLDAQGGLCALCKKPPSSHKRNLSVDHCHRTGRVRGLLCDLCNWHLGKVDRDPSIVERIRSYLSEDRGGAGNA
jgi:hypothetical protein